MNKNNLVLILAGTLVLIGLVKPDFSNLLPNNRPAVIENEVLAAPASDEVKAVAEKITKIFKESSAKDKKIKGQRFKSLMIDLAKLIKLDSEKEVIKSTKELRFANAVAGNMSDLDMKGEFVDLAKTCTEVTTVSLGGTEDILLTPELREKGGDGFLAIAWAVEQGLK
jgi:hypothetical protein